MMEEMHIRASKEKRNEFSSSVGEQLSVVEPRAEASEGLAGILFYFDDNGQFRAEERGLSTRDSIALLAFARHYADARAREILVDSHSLPITPQLLAA